MIRICIFFPYPSILRILPFHAFAPPWESNPGAMVKQLRVITITLCSLHQLIDKMSHVNQMYEKGNVSIRKEKKYRECSIRQVTLNPPKWGSQKSISLMAQARVLVFCIKADTGSLLSRQIFWHSLEVPPPGRPPQMEPPKITFLMA